MKRAEKLEIIDIYKSEYNHLLNIDLPCVKIVQSSGLNKHIEKRHPVCLKYINQIPQILKNPDYIGTNPKEKNSIEFVKVLEDNVLVAIKLDINNNQFYVASLYDITQGKLERRLNSRRLIKFSLDKDENM